MSSMDSAAWRAQLALSLLVLIALLAVVGHFALDAACLGAEAPGAALCGAGRGSLTAAGASTLCSWHTGFALALLVAVSAPLVLALRQCLVRPQAHFALFPLPLLPPKTSPIA